MPSGCKCYQLITKFHALNFFFFLYSSDCECCQMIFYILCPDFCSVFCILQKVSDHLCFISLMFVLLIWHRLWVFFCLLVVYILISLFMFYSWWFCSAHCLCFLLLSIQKHICEHLKSFLEKVYIVIVFLFLFSLTFYRQFHSHQLIMSIRLWLVCFLVFYLLLFCFLY